MSTPQEIADQAKYLYQAGNFSSAARSFSLAAEPYAEASAALMSAEMQNNCSVALLRAKQAQAALEAAQGTEKVFEQAGDFRRQGIALANQASALGALKRDREAIESYEKAGAVLEKAREDGLRAEVMQLLAVLYLRRFKVYEAIVALQSGLSGLKNPTPGQRFMKKILFIRL